MKILNKEGVKRTTEYGYLTLLYEMEDMNNEFNCYFQVIKVRRDGDIE